MIKKIFSWYKKEINEGIILLLFIIIIVILSIYYLIKPLSGYIKDFNSESLYWLFSSSAQSVSAFVAFLVTGYSIVLHVMSGIENKDDSLDVIIHESKVKNYQTLKIMSLLTAIAIILSLMMLLLNKIEYDQKTSFVIVVFLLNIATVIIGVIFVISILDPNEYKKIAENIIKKRNYNANIEIGHFIEKFIEFEKLLYKIIDLKGIRQKNFYKTGYGSVKEILDALLTNQIINRNIHTSFSDVNNYRNLVVHGKLEKVDINMYNNLIEFINQLNNLVQNNINLY